MKIKESVTKLTTGTLSNVKGCSLLTSLTDKFRSRLAQEERVGHTKVDLTHPQWDKPVVTTVSSTPSLQSTISESSSLDEEQVYGRERMFDVDISKVIGTEDSASFSSMDLQDDPCQICLIGENIWIGGNCESSGEFYIFNTSDETIEGYNLQHDTGVRTFCQSSHDKIIAVCKTGLVVIDMEGNFVVKFSEDHYKDICKHKDKLFAIESGSRYLDIFEMKNGLWKYMHGVSMDYHFSGDDTMITDHNCLYICVKGLSKILRCSFEGEIIKTFAPNRPKPGKFRMLSLCGFDKCGDLIVCDSKYHSIHVVIHNQIWFEYSLSEEIFPNDILLHNDFMYILSGKKQTQKLLWKKIRKTSVETYRY